MHLEILVEDSSGKRLLENLVPRIIGQHGAPHTYNFHAYKGIGKIPSNLSPKTAANKRILLDQLPRILKGYASTPGIDCVVVVVDSDRKNCAAFLHELKQVAAQAGLPNTLFRIAIEEVEAWYLGDQDAIKLAYPRAKLSAANNYQQDSVVGTWELVADITYPGGRKAVERAGWPLPGDLKHEWAERIGPVMNLEKNASPSFKKLIDGLKRITGS